MSPPLRGIYSLDEAYAHGAKESAVLILLYERDSKPYIVFTQRAVYKGVHSGQISFPGGRKDDTDTSFEYTALRETQEEIGVNSNDISIVGTLTHLYIPVSNYLVFPYVGILNTEPNFVKEEKEVDKILEIALDDLTNERNVVEKIIQIRDRNIQYRTPAYHINENDIWGATAMILCEFLEVLKR